MILAKKAFIGLFSFRESGISRPPMSDKDVLTNLFSLFSHREDHGSQSLLLEYIKRPGSPSGGSVLATNGLFEYLLGACQKVAKEFPGRIVFDVDCASHLQLPGRERCLGIHYLSKDTGFWDVLRFIENYPDPAPGGDVSHLHASVLKSGLESCYLARKKSLTLLDLSSYLSQDISHYIPILTEWQDAGCIKLHRDLNHIPSRHDVCLEILLDPDAWCV